MPVPFLASLSARISQTLHQIVFAFPSPNTTASISSPAKPVPGQHGMEPPFSGIRALDEMLSEPGDSRAIAAGVGPLSFAGSGYGITLVLMVRRAI